LKKLHKILAFRESQLKREVIISTIKDLLGRQGNEQHPSLISHINAIYQWLCAAQDARPDHGVSAWYNLRNGWAPSYPETTGYIIPTMLNIAKVYSNDEARSRALAMADWEIEVQLPSGAIPSGTVGIDPIPAVFNTGQVLFGWVAAYQETGEERYIHAAQLAGDWLLDVQEENGAWHRKLSKLTSTQVHTYNARTAWALVQLGKVSGEQEYVNSGRRNLDWCLTQQNTNGWFANNDFHEEETPLLHTIGYVIEGLLETGVLLGEDRYHKAAKQSAEALLKALEINGTLLGRYDKHWQSPVRWRCLTGEAQTTLAWLRLYEIEKDVRFLKAAKRVNRELMLLQNIESNISGIAGAVKGSHPI
jgi:hypothetical protein